MATERNLDRDETQLIDLCYLLGDASQICNALSNLDQLSKRALNDALERAQFIATAMLEKASNFPSTSSSEITLQENIYELGTYDLLN